MRTVLRTGDTVIGAWIAVSATYSDLTLSNPSAIIELFQVHLTAAGNGIDTVY